MINGKKNIIELNNYTLLKSKKLAMQSLKNTFFYIIKI